MAMVGVGIMAMGVVGVAALSIRGRVLVAMTGVTLTEFYREENQSHESHKQEHGIEPQQTHLMFAEPKRNRYMP